MVALNRLERLQKLVQEDLSMLPDQKSPALTIPSDEDDSGGVPIDATHTEGILIDVTESPPKSTTTLPVRSGVLQQQQEPERGSVLVEGAAGSYHPKSERQTTTTTPVSPSSLPIMDLQRGDLASPRQHFTPILALSKYPYRFCDKKHSQDIASAFFDQGKFWLREWDLYYIWDVESSKPLVLVRESQVQDLLDEINQYFGLNLRITDTQREESFVARFPDHPDCLPRCLGRSRSHEQYADMIDKTPERGFRAAGEITCGPADNATLVQFKQVMEDMRDIQNAKNKANKGLKEQERLMKQKSMADSFKRAQRYLGVREMADGNTDSVPSPSQAINFSLPAPHAFDRSVVFVCVDVESYERAHHKITEIGVATLDTRHLAAIAPGKDGEAWRECIKARHFRIKEHRHLVNHEFVHGCPDRFDYGESTFVHLQDAPMYVAACFQPPFGVHTSNTPANEVADILKAIDSNTRRNIVLLGHDTLRDISYLQKLGYDPLNVENIIEAMDTATMYRVWRREQQSTSLGRILNDFDIAGWGLHNAGNDAVFTVQIMLAICVREATIRKTTALSENQEQEKTERLKIASETAVQRAHEDAEGWSDGEEDGDGILSQPRAR